MLRFIANLLQQPGGRERPYTGKTDPANVGHPDAPGYPPPPNGIPLIDPGSLLHKHEDLLAAMRQTIGIADPIFENLYVPSIKRMADFLHLLPASESHHHRGAGGALRHAIEVAAYTSKASESVMIGSLDLPVRRKQKEVAWRYAAFISGLCHDIGKPVTDMTIHSDSGEQWNPMAEGIFEWGKKHGADHYFLSWQPNRHKMHEQFYSMMVSKIAGSEGMEYLGGVGHEAVGWVLSLNQAATIEQKKMYELVTKGDMLSVENDLRTHAGGANVAVAGVNLEKVVQDAMQNRLRLEIWTVNKLGGRVWKTSGGVFLVWPISGGEIIEDLSAMRALGLPRNQEALLSFMLERGLAVKMGESEEDGGSPVWKLRIPANNDLVATVTAIKLSEDSGIPAMLSGVAPLPDELNEAQGGGASAPAKSPQVAEPTQNPAPASDIQPRSKAPASAPKPSASRAPLPSLEEMGPHGIILESLKADMQSSRLKAGEDYIKLNDGRVAIAFPEGLNGTGVEPTTILEWLEENGMLETDPYQHDKKTHELDGFNPPKRSRKTILLTRDATSHLGLAPQTNGHNPVQKTEEKPAKEAKTKTRPEPAPEKTEIPESIEDLPAVIRKYVEELKRGKAEKNTPFLIQETEEGWYVPRHASISWFLKRCDDKNARNEIAGQLEKSQVVREVERDRKRMLYVPGKIL